MPPTTPELTMKAFLTIFSFGTTVIALLVGVIWTQLNGKIKAISDSTDKDQMTMKKDLDFFMKQKTLSEKDSWKAISDIQASFNACKIESERKFSDNHGNFEIILSKHTDRLEKFFMNAIQQQQKLNDLTYARKDEVLLKSDIQPVLDRLSSIEALLAANKN